VNILFYRLQNRLKRFLSFWAWKSLSGGKQPFYRSRKLKRFQTNIPPEESAWFGLKLKIWNKAVDYLMSIGELTFTPTLRDKF